MFTGIIEATATVATLEATSLGGRIALAQVPFAGDVRVGESVAVNGCCLTVTAASPSCDGGVLQFDLLAETLRVTNLGRLAPNSQVNLERALRAGDRLSGHYVQGHIDAVAEILDYSPAGHDHRLEVALAPEFQASVIPRGSIAIDGISLTVAEITRHSVVCWIIPHTASVTNLQTRHQGDLVNVEYDLIGKYVSRWREVTCP
ncbi:MAG: riboflavin synthase [Verrucomicrobiales bacterium]